MAKTPVGSVSWLAQPGAAAVRASETHCPERVPTDGVIAAEPMVTVVLLPLTPVAKVPPPSSKTSKVTPAGVPGAAVQLTWQVLTEVRTADAPDGVKPARSAPASEDEFEVCAVNWAPRPASPRAAARIRAALSKVTIRRFDVSARSAPAVRGCEALPFAT